MKFSTIYLVVINFISFILMGIDKKRAIHHQWRIAEKTLFMSAIIGGSIGSIVGMKFFRHKTKHKSFVIGMPIILLQPFIYIYDLLYPIHIK